MFASGVEGIYGFALFTILLIIFQFIPWTYDIWVNGKLEDSIGALQMIVENAPLLISAFLNILFVFLDVGLGMVIIKHTSAANRVTTQQIKHFIVWIFFLIYQGNGNETFKILQLDGFILIVLGAIIYNEIIEIPLFGLDQNTKAAIERNSIEDKCIDMNNASELNILEINSKENNEKLDYHTFESQIMSKPNIKDAKNSSN